MLFSIIIPTYNRADLIGFTLESVFNQTFSDFEVIIVDDGGTDNTQEIVEAFSSKDKRFTYFKKANEERGAARNLGTQKAIGDFVLFLDSDDLMEKDYLQILKKNIKEQPLQKFFATKFKLFIETGKQYEHKVPFKEGFYTIDPFLKGNYLACIFCIERQQALSCPFLEDRTYTTIEDWLFILANLKQVGKIYFIDKVGVLVRDHANRSMNNNDKVIAARKAAVNWVHDNLQLTKKQFSKLQAWSCYYCGIHYYLDAKRKQSLQETFKAIQFGGINIKFITLLLKSIVGRKIILKIK